MFKFLARLFSPKTPPPTYVITFDRHSHPFEDEPFEEYYGYFRDRFEALTIWQIYTEGHPDTFSNVCLCEVKERWDG